MLKNIPKSLWKKARMKSIELDIPMKYVMFTLLEKWVKAEINL